MENRTDRYKKFAEMIEAMAAEKRLINDHISKGKAFSELKLKGVRFVKPI